MLEYGEIAERARLRGADRYGLDTLVPRCNATETLLCDELC